LPWQLRPAPRCHMTSLAVPSSRLVWLLVWIAVSLFGRYSFIAINTHLGCLLLGSLFFLYLVLIVHQSKIILRHRISTLRGWARSDCLLVTQGPLVFCLHPYTSAFGQSILRWTLRQEAPLHLYNHLTSSPPEALWLLDPPTITHRQPSNPCFWNPRIREAPPGSSKSPSRPSRCLHLPCQLQGRNGRLYAMQKTLKSQIYVLYLSPVTTLRPIILCQRSTLPTCHRNLFPLQYLLTLCHPSQRVLLRVAELLQVRA
jgi:hypothetical protein